MLIFYSWSLLRHIRTYDPRQSCFSDTQVLLLFCSYQLLSLLADFDAAALVEGAKQLFDAASGALKSIGIDVEAIGKALVQIGSDIEDLFDKKAKKRKEDEKAHTRRPP